MKGLDKPVLHWPKLFDAGSASGQGWVWVSVRPSNHTYDNGFAYTGCGYGWGNGTVNEDTGDGCGDGLHAEDGNGGKI